MNYKDWTTLKTAGKVAFKKKAAISEVKNSDGITTTHAVPEYIVIETKQYDTNTGEEKTASTSRVSLGELESDKVRLTSDKAKIDAQLTEINTMITDIKAL